VSERDFLVGNLLDEVDGTKRRLDILERALMTQVAADSRYLGKRGVITVFDVTDPEFGAVGNGVANDTTAIRAAADAAAAVGGILHFPAGRAFRAPAGTDHNPLSNCTVIAYGATFINMKWSLGSNTRWFGGLHNEDSQTLLSAIFLIAPSVSVEVENITIADVVSGVYASTSFATIRNAKNVTLARGVTHPNGAKLGIGITGARHTTISHWRSVNQHATQRDDFIGMSSIHSPTHDIGISNCYVENHHTILGANVQNSAHGEDISNITITNCHAREVAEAILLKPGAGTAGFGSGRVKNVTISNITVDDPDGVAYRALLRTVAHEDSGESGIVDGVRVTNCVVSARAAEVGYAHIYLTKVGKGEIHNVGVENCLFRSPPGATGMRVTRGVQLTHFSGTGASVAATNITLRNLEIHNLNDRGIRIDEAVTNLTLDGITIDTPLQDTAEVHAVDVVGSASFRNMVVRNLPGGKREFRVTVAARTHKQATAFVGTQSAGTAVSVAAISIPHSRSYIPMVYVSNMGSAIPQNDTDYITIEVREMRSDGTTSLIASRTTQTSGLNVLADRLVPFGSTPLTGDVAHVDANSWVRARLTHTGAGQPTNQMMVYVDYVPLG
jgi:polygalacturonase